MRVTFFLGTAGITAIVVSLMTLFVFGSSHANSDLSDSDLSDKANTPAALIIPAAIIKAGKTVYNTTCFACHGKDGRGTIPGVPDFKSRKGPLKKSDEILQKHIEEGYQSPGSPLAMPPKGGNPKLTEKAIRSVIVFIRKSFTPFEKKE